MHFACAQVEKEELSNTERRLAVTVAPASVRQCFEKTVLVLRDMVGDLPGALVTRRESRVVCHLCSAVWKEPLVSSCCVS